MARCDPRPFTRLDVVLVVASAFLGVALAWATDREYRLSHGASPARSSSSPLLPDWIKDRRHDAICFAHDGAALLSGLSLGVAAATFRPRRGARRRRRLAPGHIASAASALTVVAIAAHCWAQLALFPGRGVVTPSAFPGILPAVDFYRLWREWRPTVTWAVLGAWSATIVTGRFGRTVDTADRLGRWLGLGWLALIAAQGVVYILAWM